jgi:hypothetical protein
VQNSVQSPKVVLVTDAVFWDGMMGSHQRILALCQELKKHVQLKVFVFATVGETARQKLVQLGLEQVVVSYKSFNAQARPDATPAMTQFADYPGLKKRRYEDYYNSFAHFIQDNCPDAVIVEYIYLAYLLDAVPDRCFSIIDTHDIMCHREYRFHSYGTRNAISMSVSALEEKTILNRFDAVLAIQEQEYQTLRKMLPEKLVLLCPHTAAYLRSNLSSSRLGSKRNLRGRHQKNLSEGAVRSLGFIGADNQANYSGLQWFLSQVWPVLKPLGLEFYIFGSVGDRLEAEYAQDPSIHNKSSGLEQNEIYQLTDCMINPVFMGGGLKIKTLEALTFKKPIVSTVEGAVGIGQEGSNGILVARNRAEFIEAILRLVYQPQLVGQLVKQGQQVIQNQFSPEACYSPLVQLLSYI